MGAGVFCDMLWGAAIRLPHDLLYATLLMFALGLTCYILTFATGVWGAFGTEQIRIQAGSLLWTRRALSWTRTKEIPVDDITEITAITPWHRFRNTVEVIAAHKRSRIGDSLLRDEAVELAQHLRRAIRFTK